jgi:hypothetical protein
VAAEQLGEARQAAAQDREARRSGGAPGSAWMR